MRRMMVVLVLILLGAAAAWTEVNVTVQTDGAGKVEVSQAEAAVNPEGAKEETGESAETSDAAAEKKGEEAPPPPLDIGQLKEDLAKFEGAIYQTEQDKIAAGIAARVKPNAAQLLKLATDGKTPSPDIVRLLGFARSDEANAFLVKMLSSSDPSVRSAAVFALGVSGDAKAVDKLIERLGDADAKTASQAAIALGRTGDKRAWEALEKRLGAKDPVTRLSAIKALGLLRDERAVPRLEKHLQQTEDPLETTAVLDALNRIAGDDLFRIIAELERVAEVLQRHGTGRQTQLAQAAITEALDRFIKKAEDQQQGQGQGQGQGKKRQTSSGQQPGQQSGSASGGQGGSSPATQSHNNPAPQVDSSLADITRTAGVVWGNLPPAVQEEVTAALKEELPERYKHLLKIYYKILAEGK